MTIFIFCQKTKFKLTRVNQIPVITEIDEFKNFQSARHLGRPGNIWAFAFLSYILWIVIWRLL